MKSPVELKKHIDRVMEKVGAGIIKPQDVKSQPHYQNGIVEVIDVTANLPAWKQNAIKYIFRAGLKGDESKFFEDLEKVEVYIEYGRRLRRGEPVSESLRKFVGVNQKEQGDKKS